MWCAWGGYYWSHNFWVAALTPLPKYTVEILPFFSDYDWEEFLRRVLCHSVNFSIEVHPLVNNIRYQHYGPAFYGDWCSNSSWSLRLCKIGKPYFLVLLIIMLFNLGPEMRMHRWEREAKLVGRLSLRRRQWWVWMNTWTKRRRQRVGCLSCRSARREKARAPSTRASRSSRSSTKKRLNKRWELIKVAVSDRRFHYITPALCGQILSPKIQTKSTSCYQYNTTGWL